MPTDASARGTLPPFSGANADSLQRTATWPHRPPAARPTPSAPGDPQDRRGLRRGDVRRAVVGEDGPGEVLRLREGRRAGAGAFRPTCREAEPHWHHRRVMQFGGSRRRRSCGFPSQPARLRARSPAARAGTRRAASGAPRTVSPRRASPPPRGWRTGASGCPPGA